MVLGPGCYRAGSVNIRDDRRPGFRVVEMYRQTDFPKMYIDMQPIVERMQLEESLEDFEE